MYKGFDNNKSVWSLDNDSSELVISGQFGSLFDDFGTLEGSRRGILNDSDHSFQPV